MQPQLSIQYGHTLQGAMADQCTIHVALLCFAGFAFTAVRVNRSRFRVYLMAESPMPYHIYIYDIRYYIIMRKFDINVFYKPICISQSVLTVNSLS